MKYPRYTFLTYGSYVSQWWAKNYTTDDQCSPEDIAEVLHHSLAVVHFHRSRSDSMFFHTCYDATQTLVLALNKTIEGIYIVFCC